MLKVAIGILLCGFISVQAQVTLSNRVLRSGGGTVSGATVTLAGNPLWSAVTSDSGSFTLAQGTSIQPGQVKNYSFSLNRSGVSLVLDKSVTNGRMELFAWNGQKVSSVSLNGMDAGLHQLSLPPLSMGVYFLNVRIDGATHSHRLLHIAEGKFADVTASEGTLSENANAATPGSSGSLTKTSAAVTDTLVISKTGYETMKIPLTTTTNPLLRIVLKPECTIPALPTGSLIAANAKMPDPFMSLSGTRITTKEQWGCRRAEIDKQFQTYELGIKPPRPRIVSGSYTGTTLTITVGDGTKTMSFNVTITKPTTGAGPFPVLIGVGGSNLMDVGPLGVATINFNNDEFAKNTGGSADRNKGKYYDFISTRDSTTAGALMAWAWGVSRIIDVLEMMPELNLDPSRIAVTGCSRNGKGAMIAGAFDERIILTLPHESGSGGAASWRGSDFTNSTAPNTAQALNQIVGEQPWFSMSLNYFATSSRTNKLPLDHHMLAGLVSPRAIFIMENIDYPWLGATSTVNNAYGARPIFQALGTSDAFSYSQLGSGTGHCTFNSTVMGPWITSYVTKYLLNGAATKTSTIETKVAFTFDATKWIDWTTPTLQ